MLGLGPTELIVILVLALIIIGPGKLPEVGRALGSSLREFRQATQEPDVTAEQRDGKRTA